jgi:hypothetical protein
MSAARLNAATEALAARIAERFVANLRESLEPDDFEEMQLRNVDVPDGICASHDFCDANMPMGDAFESVMGFEPLTFGAQVVDGEKVFLSELEQTPDVDALNEFQCALWSRAWALAMPALTLPPPAVQTGKDA